MRAAFWTAWLCLWSLAAHATEFQRLSGHDITARFAGQEFTDEHHFSEVFGGGGALVGTYLGARRPGGWRVSGDELCLTRGREDER